MKYMFFCDFDGTVTKEDAIAKGLEEFAIPPYGEKKRQNLPSFPPVPMILTVRGGALAFILTIF